MTAARIPFLMGHSEIAALYGVKTQTSQLWRSNGVLAEPDLIASGNPYWLLSTAMWLRGQASREVDTERLHAYRAAHPQGYDEPDSTKLPIIVGIQEVARLCRVDSQAVSRWRYRGSIADADLVLSRSPLWLLDTILGDARRRERDLDPGYLQQLRAGKRSPQKPRGSRSGTPLAERQPLPPLPDARIFNPSEQREAMAFVRELLAGGFSVSVRARR
ncbi:hypothetical protein [Streptomyces sp. YIM S03343]